MKKIIFLALLVMACSPKDPTPTYNSIEGAWRFSSAEVNGQFNLVTIGGVLTTNNSGYAVINGVRFDITVQYATSGKLPNPITIYLVGTNQANVVTFRECAVNKSYDAITPFLYDWYTNNTSTQGSTKLTITR